MFPFISRTNLLFNLRKWTLFLQYKINNRSNMKLFFHVEFSSQFSIPICSSLYYNWRYLRYEVHRIQVRAVKIVTVLWASPQQLRVAIIGSSMRCLSFLKMFFAPCIVIQLYDIHKQNAPFINQYFNLKNKKLKRKLKLKY
jgi:hypothetical protein